MARRGRESSDSDSDSDSDSGSVDEANKVDRMTEYEKQRLSRMAENKARLEALGISKAAKALLTPSPASASRGKPNSVEEEDEDDDYTPEDEIGDDDEEYEGNSSSVSRKSKKKKPSASKRKLVLNLNRYDPLGEDDDDLNKAIALSLQDSVAVAGSSRGKKKRNDQEARSWKKKKPELMMSKMHMSEDELVIYFYQFDEAGKGFITLRDVVKMATVHDFTWTDEELQDMISCFDMDKDGKLSLDEFRKIVTRCRMLKES